MPTKIETPPAPTAPGSTRFSRRTLLILGGVALAVVVAVSVTVTALVVGGGGANAPAAAAPRAAGGAVTCAWTPFALPAKNVKQPPASVPASGQVTVAISSNRGPLTFTLDRAAAPCTVASFVSLAQQGYFDDSPCHRVTTAGIWVIQCGDPTGSGTGNPGYFVPDEATGHERYPAGTLAMARTGDPNSGGSQFFVVYKDSPSLQRQLGTRQYTVFGTVSAGLDVLQKVAAAGAQTGSDGRPKLPLQLLTVRTS